MTRYYQKAQMNLANMNLKFQTTIKVFEMISGKDNKDRRKRIFSEYCKQKKANVSKIIYKDELAEDAYRLKENMNQAGVLFNAGLVDTAVFLDTYASYVIRIGIALIDDVDTQRKNNREASKFFEKMYDASLEYWKTHYPNEPIPEPYCD
jgi:hypothetical protein